MATDNDDDDDDDDDEDDDDEHDDDDDPPKYCAGSGPFSPNTLYHGNTHKQHGKASNQRCTGYTPK